MKRLSIAKRAKVVKLTHNWKCTVCHLEELEAVRVFQLPVDCPKGFPIYDVKLSIIPPVFFA